MIIASYFRSFFVSANEFNFFSCSHVIHAKPLCWEFELYICVTHLILLTGARWLERVFCVNYGSSFLAPFPLILRWCAVETLPIRRGAQGRSHKLEADFRVIEAESCASNLEIFGKFKFDAIRQHNLHMNMHAIDEIESSRAESAQFMFGRFSSRSFHVTAP